MDDRAESAEPTERRHPSILIRPYRALPHALCLREFDLEAPRAPNAIRHSHDSHEIRAAISEPRHEARRILLVSAPIWDHDPDIMITHDSHTREPIQRSRDRAQNITSFVALAFGSRR